MSKLTRNRIETSRNNVKTNQNSPYSSYQIIRSCNRPDHQTSPRTWNSSPYLRPELHIGRIQWCTIYGPRILPRAVDRSVWTESDRKMSLFMLTSIANFGHLGRPTASQILGIFWERSTPADIKYLALNGTNNSTMDRRYVPTWPPTTEYW